MTTDDATTGKLDPARPSVDEDGVTLGGVGLASVEALEVGATLGRYRILEPLGQGAMGIVHAAYDPRLDRRVALKVLHLPDEPGASASEGPQRLVREAQALAKLAHPNVVAVHDAGVVGGRVFVAMELVAGVTLREWVVQIDREWRDIVEHAVLAGRGLAAAHEAGLVHRDFKPENVIVGDDGRVRVLDFGLARSSGDRAPPAQLDTNEDADEQLTRTGALVGTPAYMAPEQFTGGAIDARSDQFAFCVTVWELVYRQRPFRGSGAAALGYQITREAPSPPPADAAVPAWLLPLLQRGLAKDPAERHASMAVLLDAIDAAMRPPAPRATRWPLALAGAAVLATAAGAVLWLGDADKPCSHAAERIAENWGPAQQSAIRSAFAATQSPIADDTRERVTAAIDRWTAKWIASHTAACEATHVRHEQSETALDLRMRCLERMRAQLGSFVATLGEADAMLVQQAVSATEKLGDVARCADVDALANVTPLPDDPAIASRITELDAAIGEARGLAQAGRFATARDQAIAIADEARTLGYRPLEAEAEHLATTTHFTLKEIEPAGAAATRSATAALAAGDPHGATLSMVQLCRMAASANKPDEAKRCIAIAGGTLERAGSPPALAAVYREAEGLIAFEGGEIEVGLAALRDAVAIREAEGDTGALGNTLHNYGDACRSANKLEEADAVLGRAVALRERLLGKEHPDVASSLNSLAVVHIEQKRTDLAIPELERVLAIRKATFGPEHDHVAATYNNLGIAHRKGDQCAEAVPLFERAIAMRVRGLGEAHPKVAAMRATLAGCKLVLGELDVAAALATSAIEGLGDPQFGEDRCDAVGTLADVYTRKGDAAAADATRALCAK